METKVRKGSVDKPKEDNVEPPSSSRTADVTEKGPLQDCEHSKFRLEFSLAPQRLRMRYWNRIA